MLSDFGLAVQIDASHHTFAHAGTLAYMAPEQLHNQALPASDIFALGVTLYQLCTGYLPFHRELKDLGAMLAGSEPVPLAPSQLNHDLPCALDAPILRALQADPADRYRSAAAFWNEIAAVLSETQLASETQFTVASPTPAPASKRVAPVLGIPTEEMPPETAIEVMMDAKQARDSDATIRRVTNPHISQVSVPKALALSSPVTSVPSRRRAATPEPPHPQPVTPDLSQRQARRLQPGRRLMSRFFVPTVVVVAVLLLFALGLIILPPLLAASATVTLIPRSQVEQNTFPLPSAQVHARRISATASPQSATGNASGTIPATKARGKLTFLNQAGTDVTIQSAVITDKNGIQVSFTGPLLVSATANNASATAPGIAVQAGANGNIPSFDITMPCCAPNHEIVVENTTAFVGGADARPNARVLQGDIDQAAKSLEASQTQQAQAQLATQVQSNEQTIVETLNCSSTVTPNVKAGAQATSVTVTVAVSCSEEVYDQAATQTQATSLLSAQAPPGYALSGQVMVRVLGLSAANTIQLHAQGQWFYHFSQTQLKQLALLIAGKSQAQAQTVLREQPGVLEARISGPATLPSADRIQIQVQPGGG